MADADEKRNKESKNPIIVRGDFYIFFKIFNTFFSEAGY